MLLTAPLLRQLGRLLPQAARRDGGDIADTAIAMPHQDRQGAVSRLAQDEAEHRLANLFQIVVGNLDRAARSSDGPARRAIDDAADQVSMLFRLQELLGGLGAGGRTCHDNMHALGETLDRLLLRPRGHVLTVEVGADVAHIVLHAAAIHGLSQAIVESVINVAKHAFPAGPGGRVALRLSRAGGYVACSIVDDGLGGVGATRPGSRGMTLIDNLARHAGAQCCWVFGNGGTEVRILWPVETSDPLKAHTQGLSPPFAFKRINQEEKL